jgi:hypothetical protein
MDDERYFKFTKIKDDLIKSLRDGTLWFSCRNQLNDPFDCAPDIEKAIRNAASLSRITSPQHTTNLEKLLSLLKKDLFFDRLPAMLDKIGIFCSSYTINIEFQTLLWAHYADNHKGVCILYEIPKSFFNEINCLGVTPVTYEKNSITDWFNSDECHNFITDWLQRIRRRLSLGKATGNLLEYEEDLFKRILSAKSPPWAYEREVRIIRPRWGSFAVPKEFVKQICFGLQSTNDDINTIRAVLDGYDQKLPLYKAVPDGSDFGITYDEI